MREAARRTDAKARGKMADADKLRTIFFLGFEADEQLSDRLAALKHQARLPADALALPIPLTAAFSSEKFAAAVGEAPFAVVPGGRQLKGKAPVAPEDAMRRLAAALVPLADQYPMPFYKFEG